MNNNDNNDNIIVLYHGFLGSAATRHVGQTSADIYIDNFFGPPPDHDVRLRLAHAAFTPLFGMLYVERLEPVIQPVEEVLEADADRDEGGEDEDDPMDVDGGDEGVDAAPIPLPPPHDHVPHMPNFPNLPQWQNLDFPAMEQPLMMAQVGDWQAYAADNQYIAVFDLGIADVHPPPVPRIASVTYQIVNNEWRYGFELETGREYLVRNLTPWSDGNFHYHKHRAWSRVGPNPPTIIPPNQNPAHRVFPTLWYGSQMQNYREAMK